MALLRRCARERRLSFFLSGIASLAASPSTSPPAPAASYDALMSAYNAVMSDYSRAGCSDEVLRLFRSLPFPPTAPIFTTLIISLTASGRHRAARAAFSQLLVSGLPPSAAAFTALLEPDGAASPESSYHLINAMFAAGCSPDVAAYNRLISALCNSHCAEEATGVLDVMVDHGVSPNVRSYTPILRVFCEQGRIVEAEGFVDAMVHVGCPPDVISYNVLIDGFCRVGRFREVERVMEESEVKGWTPNDETYNIYMSALCRMGFFVYAFHQIQVMRRRGLPPTADSLNVFFVSLCRASVWEAMYLLEHGEALDWEVDVFSYNTLMRQLGETGNHLPQVMKLLVDLLKKGVGPDVSSFTIAVQSLCRAGKLQLAKCLVDSKGVEYDAEAFNALMHGFFIVGNMRGFQETYMDMISRQNVHPNNFTITMVIDSLCQDQKFDEAILCFLRFLECGLVPDHLIRLNNWLIKAGKLRQVQCLLNELRSRDIVLDVSVLNSLVRICCLEGYCQDRVLYAVPSILDNMVEKRW